MICVCLFVCECVRMLVCMGIQPYLLTLSVHYPMFDPSLVLCLHSSGLLAVGATVNILDWKLVLCPGAFSRMFAAANCYSPMIRASNAS